MLALPRIRTVLEKEIFFCYVCVFTFLLLISFAATKMHSLVITDGPVTLFPAEHICSGNHFVPMFAPIAAGPSSVVSSAE